MTPFRRLALLAGSTVYALGLALLWSYLGPVVAAAVAGVGVLVALLVTLELAPRTVAVPTVEPEADDWAIRRRERRDIERSAEQARDE